MVDGDEVIEAAFDVVIVIIVIVFFVGISGLFLFILRKDCLTWLGENKVKKTKQNKNTVKQRSGTEIKLVVMLAIGSLKELLGGLITDQ